MASAYAITTTGHNRSRFKTICRLTHIHWTKLRFHPLLKPQSLCMSCIFLYLSLRLVCLANRNILEMKFQKKPSLWARQYLQCWQKCERISIKYEFYCSPMNEYKGSQLTFRLIGKYKTKLSISKPTRRMNRLWKRSTLAITIHLNHFKKRSFNKLNTHAM